ncbi:hypothetical protein [Streptomyces sp. NPDC002573]|uniref:hypothetical protein n=1 Tax=Streptomyces sp. NPDC002573 TaxID=3364651 RepID=UPI0036B5AD9E
MTFGSGLSSSRRHGRAGAGSGMSLVSLTLRSPDVPLRLHNVERSHWTRGVSRLFQGIPELAQRFAAVAAGQFVPDGYGERNRPFDEVECREETEAREVGELIPRRQFEPKAAQGDGH